MIEPDAAILATLLLILGLAALTCGAEILVRGASELAHAARVPALIVGLTVVAFGTSAPELAVGVKAGLAGQGDLAVGNVIGSNTFNVLFILGISAVITPLVVSSQLIRLDVPAMICVSGLVWTMGLDGTISRSEGVALVSVFIVYTGVLIRLGRRESSSAPQDDPNTRVTVMPVRLAWSAFLVLGGLGLLVLGSGWLVDGAVVLARGLGMSELVIGLTIVAAGTSMPEVATSIMASIRGHRDIAVGNIVGSNLTNLLIVLGGSALVTQDGLAVAEPVLRFDVPIMLAVAVACLPIFFTGGRIARWEGAVLLGYYAAYVAFLILAAIRHAHLEPFSMVMLWFVIPMTVLGLSVSIAASIRTRRRKLVS